MFVPPHLGMSERNLFPRKDFRHAGIDPPVEYEFVRRRRLFEMGEMRALDTLLAHPDEARVKGQVEAGGAGAEDHHASAFDHETGDRKGLLAGVFKDDVDVLLSRDVPDGL